MPKTTEKVLEIPAIDIRMLQLKVIGDSSLIVHRWGVKVLKEILDKQMRRATKGKAAKDPVYDFADSLYWIEGEPDEKTEEAVSEAIRNGARFGFPSIAFKAAAVDAGYRSGVTRDKASTRSAFHVQGELVEINGTPEMREDTVRIGMGVADLRYRGEFKDWSAIVPIRYNASAISEAQIANLFNLGGFACGIGEWRVERDGNHGMFHVA